MRLFRPYRSDSFSSEDVEKMFYFGSFPSCRKEEIVNYHNVFATSMQRAYSILNDTDFSVFYPSDEGLWRFLTDWYERRRVVMSTFEDICSYREDRIRWSSEQNRDMKDLDYITKVVPITAVYEFLKKMAVEEDCVMNIDSISEDEFVEVCRQFNGAVVSDCSLSYDDWISKVLTDRTSYTNDHLSSLISFLELIANYNGRVNKVIIVGASLCPAVIECSAILGIDTIVIDDYPTYTHSLVTHYTVDQFYYLHPHEYRDVNLVMIDDPSIESIHIVDVDMLYHHLSDNLPGIVCSYGYYADDSSAVPCNEYFIQPVYWVNASRSSCRAVFRFGEHGTRSLSRFSELSSFIYCGCRGLDANHCGYDCSCDVAFYLRSLYRSVCDIYDDANLIDISQVCNRFSNLDNLSVLSLIAIDYENIDCWRQFVRRDSCQIGDWSYKPDPFGYIIISLNYDIYVYPNLSAGSVNPETKFYKRFIENSSPQVVCEVDYGARFYSFLLSSEDLVFHLKRGKDLIHYEREFVYKETILGQWSCRRYGMPRSFGNEYVLIPFRRYMYKKGCLASVSYTQNGVSINIDSSMLEDECVCCPVCLNHYGLLFEALLSLKPEISCSCGSVYSVTYGFQ